MIRRWVEALDRKGRLEVWQLRQALKAVEILMGMRGVSGDGVSISWEELEGLLEAHDHLMAEVERVKKPYLLPQTLRELTTMRRGLARIRRKLASPELLPAEEVFFG